MQDESGGGGGDGGFIGGGFGGGPSAGMPLDTPGDPDVIGGPVAREETSEERWTRWESVSISSVPPRVTPLTIHEAACSPFNLIVYGSGTMGRY